MAAIREWFAAYGILFDHVAQLGGEAALADYEAFLGGRVHTYLGAPMGREALEALGRYYEDNAAKDGGGCQTALEAGRLAVEIDPCADWVYFAEAPYEGHRFGPEYCLRCQEVQRALGGAAGLAVETTAPVAGADGTRSCTLCFSLKEEEK